MTEQVPEIVVSSWTGAIEELFRDSWDEAIRRHRSPFVFRGMSDAQAKLSTSLKRMTGSAPDLDRLEGHMLRSFRKYGHGTGASTDSVWAWLARAQHYGMKTRLLDWSYSPLVALHFATVRLDMYHADGAVWMVDHRKTVDLLPPDLRNAVRGQGSNAFTEELLAEVAPSLEDFGRLSPDPFVVFLEPPSLDARITNQFALFSLMSSSNLDLDDLLSERVGLARKIVIPSRMKQEFRDKLDQSGISERMLFPGLDGLARFLSRYYLPAPRVKDE